jgi:hypothetical protein
LTLSALARSWVSTLSVLAGSWVSTLSVLVPVGVLTLSAFESVEAFLALANSVGFEALLVLSANGREGAVPALLLRSVLLWAADILGPPLANASLESRMEARSFVPRFFRVESFVGLRSLDSKACSETDAGLLPRKVCELGTEFGLA